MANLIDIQAQIDTLQKQAEAIRTKEFAATVADIRAKMAAFGITLKDLQLPARSGKRKYKGSTAVKVLGSRAAPPKSPKAGIKVEPKFKGPNGESWSGRGMMPKWLSSLVAQGRTKEEFAVKL